MPDIEWIRNQTTPIAIKYGLKKMSLFGSYAKGTAYCSQTKKRNCSEMGILSSSEREKILLK